MEISSECLQPSTKGKRIQPRERSDGVSSMIARGRKAISRQRSAFSQGAPHLAVPRDPPIVRTTWGRAFWPAMTPGVISRAVARPDSVCPAPRWTKGTPPAGAANLAVMGVGLRPGAGEIPAAARKTGVGGRCDPAPGWRPASGAGRRHCGPNGPPHVRLA